jgi:hypothetical protein
MLLATIRSLKLPKALEHKDFGKVQDKRKDGLCHAFSRRSRRFPYNCLVEISRILIRRIERTYVVLRRFQDVFLSYFHKHLGFLVADALNLFR